MLSCAIDYLSYLPTESTGEDAGLFHSLVGAAPRGCPNLTKHLQNRGRGGRALLAPPLQNDDLPENETALGEDGERREPTGVDYITRNQDTAVPCPYN